MLNMLRYLRVCCVLKTSLIVDINSESNLHFGLYVHFKHTVTDNVQLNSLSIFNKIIANTNELIYIFTCRAALMTQIVTLHECNSVSIICAMHEGLLRFRVRILDKRCKLRAKKKKSKEILANK